MSFGAYIVNDEAGMYEDDFEDEGYELGYLGKNKPPKKPKKKAIRTPKAAKLKTRPRIVPISIGRQDPLPATTIFETGGTKIDVQNTPPIIPNIEINNNSTNKSGGGSWLDKLLREGRSMFDQYVGGGRRQEIDAGGNIVRSGGGGGGRGDVDASIGAGLDFDANEKGLGIGGKVNISTWLMIGGGALFLVFLLGMMRKSKSR